MNKSIITISRQYGSGGRFIGQKLAQQLDIPFYDNELITIAAKESGFSEEFFENAEQKTSSSFLYSLYMYSISAGMAGLPLSDQIFMVQADVIREIAQKGPCVIVGRCADYVLKDHPDCVNIYIHSNLENRIKRAVKYYGLSEENAKDAIMKTDKKRASYYNYYSNKKWGAAENYHLALNSDSIGIDPCVEVIKQFVIAKEALKNS